MFSELQTDSVYALHDGSRKRSASASTAGWVMRSLAAGHLATSPVVRLVLPG